MLMFDWKLITMITLKLIYIIDYGQIIIGKANYTSCAISFVKLRASSHLAKYVLYRDFIILHCNYMRVLELKLFRKSILLFCRSSFVFFFF